MTKEKRKKNRSASEGRSHEEANQNRPRSKTVSNDEKISHKTVKENFELIVERVETDTENDITDDTDDEKISEKIIKHPPGRSSQSDSSKSGKMSRKDSNEVRTFEEKPIKEEKFSPRLQKLTKQKNTTRLQVGARPRGMSESFKIKHKEDDHLRLPKRNSGSELVLPKPRSYTETSTRSHRDHSHELAKKKQQQKTRNKKRKTPKTKTFQTLGLRWCSYIQRRKNSSKKPCSKKICY